MRPSALSLVLVSLLACGSPQTRPQSPPSPDPAPGDSADRATAVASSAPRDSDDEEPETMPMAAALPTGGEKLQCTQKEQLGPFRVSRQAYDARHGAAATKFSEALTEKASPLEACGIGSSLAELVRLTCDDGTSPFNGNTRAAHASRQGSIGAGGRCGAIIDAYEVSCPETTYVVHVDMYFCGPDTKWE